MPNRKHQYYIGDKITFRGVFKVDGVEQEPDAGSALAEIWKRGDTTTAVQASTAATIVSNQIQYAYTTTEEGSFQINLTAEYETAADKRTGVIEFTVKQRKAY